MEIIEVVAAVVVVVVVEVPVRGNSAAAGKKTAAVAVASPTSAVPPPAPAAVKVSPAAPTTTLKPQALGSSIGQNNLAGVRRFLVQLDSIDEAISIQGRTILHIAAMWGRRDVVAFLIGAGASRIPKDKAGKTPADLVEDRLALWGDKPSSQTVQIPNGPKCNISKEDLPACRALLSND
eukprot:gene10304-biopygen4924